MFPYRGALWGWNDVDAFLSKNLEADWALIVKTICVIDCDTEEAATDLMTRFPCLAEAPTARTTRGMHFYFLRSALADADGYWDQTSKIIKKVDFKTMTQTGTGGVVVVSPSHGKTWIRPIMTTPLTEIPDDLLMRVAVPSFMKISHSEDSDEDSDKDSDLLTSSVSSTKNSNDAHPLFASNAAVLLKFASGEEAMHIDGMQLEILNRSEYFEAILSGRWNDVNEKDEIPSLNMPCERAVCEEIFSLLENETLTPGRAPTRSLLVKIDTAMDMLGFSYPKNPLLMRHSFFVDLYDISPEWFFTHQSELSLMLGTSAEASDESLVFVTEDLASWIGYDPLLKDSRWLFEELPLLLDAETWKNNKVLVDYPSDRLNQTLPPIVLEILQLYPDHIVVAGGAVLGGVSRFSEDGTDIDMFIYGLDQNESSKLLQEVEELVSKKFPGGIPKRSKSAFMFFAKERRPQLVAENPEWKFGEFGRKMGEEWRGMSDKKKGKYNNKAAADKVRYAKEMEEGMYKKTSSVAALTFTWTGKLRKGTVEKKKKKNQKPPTAAECEADETESRAKNRTTFLHNRPFQIILGLHRARSQILEYFDLAPCKVLARMHALTGKLVVEALPSFVLSLKNMCFVVDIMYWSPASVTRITKYVAKGFEVFVPGIKRDAFKKEFTPLADHFKLKGGGPNYWGGTKEHTTDSPKSYVHFSPNQWREDLSVPENVQGIGVLFVAESDMLRSRNFEFPECEWVEPISGRLEKIEAETIASKCAGNLGVRTYGSGGTYGFIRESFRRHVAGE